MEYKIEGELQTASKPETIKTKNGEKQKRYFILKTNEEYPQVLQFELFGDKLKLIEGFHTGDNVMVTFSLRGRVWEKPETGKKVYIMSLSVRDIEAVGGVPQEDEPDMPETSDQEYEDLPF